MIRWIIKSRLHTAFGALPRSLFGGLLFAVLISPSLSAKDGLEIDKSGTMYVQHCRAAANADDAAFDRMNIDQGITAAICNSYTAGAIQGLGVANEVSKKTGGMLFNLPSSGMSVKQSMLLTIRYIDRHPEKMHLSTIVLMGYALKDAYPPTQNNPKP